MFLLWYMYTGGYAHGKRLEIHQSASKVTHGHSGYKLYFYIISYNIPIFQMF